MALIGNYIHRVNVTPEFMVCCSQRIPQEWPSQNQVCRPCLWNSRPQYHSLGTYVYYTRKGQKAFLLFSTNPPKFPLKKICRGNQNLLISTLHCQRLCWRHDCHVHSSALKIIDQKASSLDLKLKPENCVSFLYDGKDIDKRSTFSLSLATTQ